MSSSWFSPLKGSYRAQYHATCRTALGRECTVAPIESGCWAATSSPSPVGTLERQVPSIRDLRHGSPNACSLGGPVIGSGSRLGLQWVSHIRGVGSNDRDVSTADLRAPALTVPFVASADAQGLRRSAQDRE
jgi:hypothetical protein